MTSQINSKPQQETRLQPSCEALPEAQGDMALQQEPQGPPKAYLEALEALSSQYQVVIPIIHNLDAPEKDGPEPTASITYSTAQYAMSNIRNAAPTDQVCLVLHTGGGIYLASEMIADQIRRHPGKVTVFVPYIATSGGTAVALAADELVLGQAARLGPIDSMTWGHQSSSFAKLKAEKSVDRIEDQTLLVGYCAGKFDEYAKRNARKRLNPIHYGIGEDKFRVADFLSSDQNSHGRGFDREDLIELGVRLADVDDCPTEVYALVDA